MTVLGLVHWYFLFDFFGTVSFGTIWFGGIWLGGVWFGVLGMLIFLFFWCAWYAKILEYLLFWSNMIGGGMVWFGPLGMQDESKDCQQKPSNHYRAHLIYIIFSFYLNILFYLHIIFTWSPCVLRNFVSICIDIHPPSPSSMNKRADASEYFKQKWTGQAVSNVCTSEKNYLNWYSSVKANQQSVKSRCIRNWNCDIISIDIHLHCFSFCRQSSISKQNGCIGIGRKRDGPDVQTNSTLKLPFRKYKHRDKLMFF